MKRRDFVVLAPSISAVALAAAMALPTSSAQAQTWFGLDTQAGPAGTWKKLLTKTDFTINYTFPAGLTLNFNARNFALSVGWDGTKVLKANFIVPNVTTIGSTSSATPAFDTDTAFPNGSTLSVQIDGVVCGYGGKGGTASSNAAVRSAGSNGGLALLVRYTTTISGTGKIGGGGGGGGAGAGSGWYYNNTSCDKSGNCSVTSTVTRYFGAAGGGEGAGANRGGSGVGDTYINTRYVYRYAAAASAGTPTTGGVGAAGTYGSDGPNDYATGGAGGNGGGLGQSGFNGGGGGWSGECCFYPTAFVWYPLTAGGAPGIAVQGNSYVTWLTTPTILGARVG